MVSFFIMYTSHKDTLNFFSKLSLRRAKNILLVYFSYQLTRLLRKQIIWSLPFAVEIEPTTSCNLRCPECPSGLRKFSRPTGMLEERNFEKFINQIYKDISYLTFYLQGEPYLNPKFLDMVKYANEKKIYTTTSTNAHYLKPENAKKTIEAGLDRILISIDGVTQDTYQKYRIGGKLEKVWEGLQNLSQAKKEVKSATPHIIVQMIVNNYNEHQIDEMQELATSYGADEVRFKTMQIYDYKDGSEFIPENEKYARYHKKGDQYKINNSFPDECWRLWHSSVITWDGKVIPCCFDKDADHQFGELKDNSFKEIWKSKPYRDFRDQILSDRQQIEICKNCSEGTKIWEN